MTTYAEAAIGTGLESGPWVLDFAEGPPMALPQSTPLWQAKGIALTTLRQPEWRGPVSILKGAYVSGGGVRIARPTRTLAVIS